MVDEVVILHGTFCIPVSNYNYVLRKISGGKRGKHVQSKRSCELADTILEGIFSFNKLGRIKFNIMVDFGSNFSFRNEF